MLMWPPQCTSRVTSARLSTLSTTPLALTHDPKPCGTIFAMWASGYALVLRGLGFYEHVYLVITRASIFWVDSSPNAKECYGHLDLTSIYLSSNSFELVQVLKLLVVLSKCPGGHRFIEVPSPEELGVDSSYHIWTHMSVRRDITWGMSVHNIHQGEVLFFSSVYIQKLH